MNLTKLATAAATGAILLNAALPAFAATTLIISGNGSGAESNVEFENESQTTVVQQNVTNVQNHINVDASTGNNEAEDNTGGDVSIETGNSTAEVAIHNQVNSNQAQVDTCGECAGDTTVEVTGNGSDSENEVELEQETKTEVYQSNQANISNDVKVDAETGDNEAEDNTNGDVAIKTGDATVKIMSHNMANMNTAVIGGEGEGGSVHLLVSGNGTDSENEIELELERETVLRQDNLTNIANHFKVDAETGKNEAEDNTGGYVEIETGDAWVEAMVDNAAGFNFADLGCCALEDIMAKIANNGSDSENEIEAELEDETEVYQGSESSTNFDNCLALDVETGKNEVEDNTAGDGEDPMVDTGDSTVKVAVSNEGSQNVLGEMDELDWEMPEFDFGFDLSISFDLSEYFAWLLGQA